MTDSLINTEFVYTTYIKTTPQKVWNAITNPEFCKQYWVNANLSDWKPGSKWEHVSQQGAVLVGGEVVESVPPKRLVMTWADPARAMDKSEHSRVTFDIEAIGEVVRLNVTHDKLKAGSEMAGKIAMGWPLVLASMKSILETGKALDIMAIKGSCG